MDDLAEFYDQWAVDYDAAHGDWRATVRLHGVQLAAALAARGVPDGGRVLDCTCGIGTQAIGLALAGYEVSGTDLSPGEIDRARREAPAFGVEATFAVADLLALSASIPGGWAPFDAVVSANSLTHFADIETLTTVFTEMAAVCRPGGVVAATNRDYDTVADARPASTIVQQSVADGIRRVSFQLWDWSADGTSYRMEDVLLTRDESDRHAAWSTRSRATTLYAWRRAEIEGAARAAELTDIVWTQHGGQPIVTGRVR